MDEAGLVFRLYDDENRAVLLRCFNSENVVHLPEEVDGLPLTEIGPEAFTDSDAVYYVKIPENVIALHGSCFAYCTSLREIVLPDSLIWCEKEAFEGTEGFTIVSHEGTRGQALAEELGVEFREGDTLSVDE